MDFLIFRPTRQRPLHVQCVRVVKRAAHHELSSQAEHSALMSFPVIPIGNFSHSIISI